MSTATQRHTKARRDKGRSHIALKKIALNKCEKCSATILPHQACKKCGNYKGRKVK
ncbi:50S ribosomal protein L32 [Patescibacteria group bacterium]|nr:50S ribosomal protein L32 [Patescibacteria group bacterium]MBU1895459.1 50S ribosomal protein L32 [Patescibacteria group bacterium]